MLVQLACLTACLVGLFSLLVQLLVSLCVGPSASAGPAPRAAGQRRDALAEGGDVGGAA